MDDWCIAARFNNLFPLKILFSFSNVIIKCKIVGCISYENFLIYGFQLKLFTLLSKCKFFQCRKIYSVKFFDTTQTFSKFSISTPTECESSMNLKKESKHKQHNFPIFTLIFHIAKTSLTDTMNQRRKKTSNIKNTYHIEFNQLVVLFLFIHSFFFLRNII